MKNNMDDLLIQFYETVPHRFIPGTVQARITARIAARNKNKELEQEIIRLKWQLNAAQTELSRIKE